MTLSPAVLAAIEAAAREGRVSEVGVRPGGLEGGQAPLARPEVQAAVTEDEFKDAVLDLALGRGWLRAHFRPAQTGRGWRTAVQGDGKGFPDLVLIRDRLVVAELKVGRNKPTADQRRWLAAFRKVGTATFVWYPGQWAEIEEVLR